MTRPSTMPIGLTDRQLLAINEAAVKVPYSERGRFICSVLTHLGADPSDAAVDAAVTAALSVNRMPSFATSGAK